MLTAPIIVTELHDKAGKPLLHPLSDSDKPEPHL